MRNILPATICLICLAVPVRADDLPGSARLAASRQFFQQSIQPTGVLVPLYHYPANIHTNAVFNSLIDLKRLYPRVPVCAIVNPASGPGGKPLDANYVNAIDRLSGAGIITLGYVSTRFAAQPADQVLADIVAWSERHPRINGLFLDEMANTPDGATVSYYVRATRAAHDAGFWPVIANPGTATPEVFFAQSAADVFVIHENAHWPAESDLKGDYFGGYADYPPWTRAILLHSQPELDRARLHMARRYVRWIYITHDRFDPNADLNDPDNNPWDELSRHLEPTLQELSK